LIANAAAIVVGSVAMSEEPSCSAILTALRKAADHGTPVVADLNIRATCDMGLADVRMHGHALSTAGTVVKLSGDDARVLWGATTIEETAQALEKFDPPISVITDGDRGAALRTRGEIIRLDAFPVDAREPTGAGDAFTAAFVSRM